jgi:hypothetical protein
MNIEDAQQLAESWIIEEKRLDDIKKSLKAWVTENGNVIHAGCNFGFHKSLGLTFPSVEQLFNALLVLHVEDPWDFFKADLRKGKRLRSKHGDYPNELSAISEPAQSIRFAKKKAGEEDDE